MKEVRVRMGHLRKREQVNERPKELESERERERERQREREREENDLPDYKGIFYSRIMM